MSSNTATVHTKTRHLISTDRDGSEIAVWVHTLEGQTAGPTLALFGPQHGDEWFTVRVIQEILLDLAQEELSGTVLIVPVSNPPALRDGSRITQASADEPDMNRAWGGKNTWIANQLTNTLTELVVDRADVIVDFHLGPTGSTFGAVCYGNDYPDAAVNERSRELALAFGYPVVGSMAVCAAFPGPRSLAGFAGTTRKIPTTLVEIGGGGHGVALEKSWRAMIVQGVRNLAITMGILQGDVTSAESVLVYTGTRRVNPRMGGLLIPAADDYELGQKVSEGELLGTIIHPQTFEVLEELTSPCDGYFLYYANSYLLRPGDWAFGVIDAASAHWTEHG